MVIPDRHAAGSPELTEFQVFILAHLTTEDMLRQREGTALGRSVPDLGHILTYRYATSISELTTIVSPDLIPGRGWDADEIIAQIESEVLGLLKRKLIIYKNKPSSGGFRGIQYEVFYISPKGKALVRKCFRGLEDLVSNQEQYDTAIDGVETGSEAKNYLRGIRTKLIDKTQDEIVQIIVSGAKRYAPAGIAMILRLVGITE